MHNWLKKTYHHLPYPARSLMATARGYQLRRLRYGPETQGLAEEALARESWSSKQWKVYQEEQLGRTLHHAATRVPYYRKHWQQRRRRGDHASWEQLENWPVLKKDTLRAIPQAFIADDVDKRKLKKEHTSGTTGMPLTLWQSRRFLLQFYALYETRVRGWNGVSIHEPWAHLGGQMVTPYHQQKPPFWVWSASLNLLYMSTFHIAPQTVKAYAQALADHGIQHIIGYCSSVNTLAHFIKESEIEAPPIKVVVGDSEPLFDHQRERIARVFNCPCKSAYGMAEMVISASECAHGAMHLWPEVGQLEVLYDNQDIRVPTGQTGRLVCTGFLLKEMPLIRYEVGDQGALGPEHALCNCGRHLPTLLRVEGRNNDMIVTPDGRRVRWYMSIFSEFHLMETRVIQQEANSLTIQFVPTPEFVVAELEGMKQCLQDRVGNMHTEFQQVSAIERGPNGKFRAVISLLDKNGKHKEGNDPALERKR